MNWNWTTAKPRAEAGQSMMRISGRNFQFIVSTTCAMLRVRKASKDYPQRK